MNKWHYRIGFDGIGWDRIELDGANCVGLASEAADASDLINTLLVLLIRMPAEFGQPLISGDQRAELVRPELRAEIY